MMQTYGLFLDEVLGKVEEEFGKVVQLLISEIVSYAKANSLVFLYIEGRYQTLHLFTGAFFPLLFFL